MDSDHHAEGVNAIIVSGLQDINKSVKLVNSQTSPFINYFFNPSPRYLHWELFLQVENQTENGMLAPLNCQISLQHLTSP
jgi:hypothetical protein